MKTEKFLHLLQKEALLQAELEKKPIFPRKMRVLLSIIARNSWQFLLLMSFLTAILLNI